MSSSSSFADAARWLGGNVDCIRWVSYPSEANKDQKIFPNTTECFADLKKAAY